MDEGLKTAWFLVISSYILIGIVSSIAIVKGNDYSFLLFFLMPVVLTFLLYPLNSDKSNKVKENKNEIPR